jgi:hypothetical protein
VVVIDDAVLLDVLAGLAPGEMLEALQGNDLFTTGCWYYRLSPGGSQRPSERLAVAPTWRS